MLAHSARARHVAAVVASPARIARRHSLASVRPASLPRRAATFAALRVRGATGALVAVGRLCFA